MAIIENSPEVTTRMVPSQSITPFSAKWHAKTIIAAMTLVLLLAAAFRIVHITQQSIWFDEAFAWNIIIQPDMYPRIAADTHPPLYYLLLRGWMEVTGDSALVLRYLSALISIGTVVFTYRTGLELIASHRVKGNMAFIPVLAALLITLSDAEIFLAQETRNYSLYTFFAALSMWMYLRWMRRPGRMAALLWSLSITALMYTHYQGAFIPAIQGMHALLFLRGRRRIDAIGALALSGVLFAPWFLGVTVPQAQNAIDNSLPYAIPTNWDTFLDLRHRYLGAIWALMTVLAVVGVANLLRGRSLIRIRAGQTFLVVMWFVLPFCVLFFGNLYAALLTERKLLIITPAIALLVAFGVARLDWLSRGLLVIVFVVYGASSVDYYRQKEPWEQIAGEIVPYAALDDLAMAEIGVGQYSLKYYWQKLLPDGLYFTTFPFLGDFTMAPTTDWFTYYDGLLPQLLAEIKNRNIGPVATAWLVFWSTEQANFQRLAEADYQRTMTITYDIGGNQVDIYRYDYIEPRPPVAEYETRMTLLAAEIDDADLRADLWWQITDEPLNADYTTSVILLDENGALVGQYDSPPFYGQRPTSTWGSDDIIFDPKPIQLRKGLLSLPPGTYSVAVQVYAWSAESGITNFMTTTGEPWAIIGTVTR